MPRKPRSRTRASQVVKPVSTSPRPENSGGRRATTTYWQCQACGGLVDAMYGSANDSWCPHCHAVGQVVGMDGQIPTPTLYGDWVAKRQGAAEQKRAERESEHWLAVHSKAKEDSTVKRKKIHSGTYHCPRCFIEFDVIAEESLKCDACGGPLAKGDLEEVWEDDGPGDDEEER